MIHKAFTQRKIKHDEEFKIPPDLKICQDYRESTSIGIGNKNSQINKFSLFPSENKKLSMCIEKSKLGFLGAGYPLFFDIMVKLMLLSLVMLPYSAFRAYNNYKGEDCLLHGDLKKLDEYIHSLDPTSPELDENPHETISDHHSSFNSFKQHKYKFVVRKGQDLQSFIQEYCFFTWYKTDEACVDFKKHKCEEEKSQECKKISFHKFKELYEERVCYKSYVNLISEGNRAIFSNDTEEGFYQRVFLKVSPYLKYLIFVFLLCFVIYIKIYDEKMNKIYDSKNLTMEDFTVYFQGLPHGNELGKKINLHEVVKKVIEKSGLETQINYEGEEVESGHKFKIKKINFIYNVKEYLEKREELKELIAEEYKHQIKNDNSMIIGNEDNNNGENLPLNEEDKYHKLEQKQREVEEVLKEYERRYAAHDPKLLTGEAYVSFDTIQDKEIMLKQRGNKFYSRLRRLCKFGDALEFRGPLTINIEGHRFRAFAYEPSEPKDIIWENQAISARSLWIRNIVSHTMSVILLILGFFLLMVIELALENFEVIEKKRHEHSTLDHILATLIHYVGAIFIYVLDFALEIYLRKMAKFRKPKTYTSEHLITFQNLWILQFCVTALIPVIFSITMLNFFGEDGLVELINKLFISNIIFQPIKVLFFDLEYWHKVWERREVEEFAKHGKGHVLTQEEANEMYENNEWRVSVAYAYALKTFAAGLFFTPIFPLALVYTTIILLEFYWCQKYILTTRSSKRYKYSDLISKAVVDQLPSCLVIFILGYIMEENLISFWNMKGFELYLENLILLIFSIFVWIFDISIFLEFVDDIDEEEGGKKFDEMKQDDKHDYELLNPATKFLAKYLELEKEQKEIELGRKV